MKKIIFASAGLMTLAACGAGGGDRQAILNTCMEDGGMEKADCECMADSAEENLNDDLYTKFAKAARQGESAAEEMMNDLSPEEQGQFVGFVMQAAMSCNISPQ
jgi:hypothetical protein